MINEVFMLKKISGKLCIHTVLIIISLLSIFPFLWLTSTSLKGLNEDIFAYPPQIIPHDLDLQHIPYYQL